MYVLLVLSLVLLLLPDAHATHKMALEVDIDVDRSQIKGKSRIAVTAGEEVVLMIGTLKIDKVMLDGETVEHDEFERTIKILPATDGELSISYTGIFKENGRSAHPAPN